MFLCVIEILHIKAIQNFLFLILTGFHFKYKCIQDHVFIALTAEFVPFSDRPPSTESPFSSQQPSKPSRTKLSFGSPASVQNKWVPHILCENRLSYKYIQNHDQCKVKRNNLLNCIKVYIVGIIICAVENFFIFHSMYFDLQNPNLKSQSYAKCFTQANYMNKLIKHNE